MALTLARIFHTSLAVTLSDFGPSHKGSRNLPPKGVEKWGYVKILFMA